MNCRISDKLIDLTGERINDSDACKDIEARLGSVELDPKNARLSHRNGISQKHKRSRKVKVTQHEKCSKLDRQRSTRSRSRTISPQPATNVRVKPKRTTSDDKMRSVLEPFGGSVDRHFKVTKGSARKKDRRAQASRVHPNSNNHSELHRNDQASSEPSSTALLAKSRRTEVSKHVSSAVDADSKAGTLSPPPQRRPVVLEICDDEEVGIGSTRYHEALDRMRQTGIQPISLLDDLNSAEVISDDEAENIADDAPFSTSQTILLEDDDTEISEDKEVPRLRLSGINGITYNCTPGKCVELADGTFMRIVKIVQDLQGAFWLLGPLFVKHNDFNDSKWPRRHSEVVKQVKIKDGQVHEMERRSPDQVVKIRQLMLTNRIFPRTSYKDYPDVFTDVDLDKREGPLFCRWKQTSVFGTSGKINEQSIERLSFNTCDHDIRTSEANARLDWRRNVSTPGGSHSDHQGQRYTFGDIFCGGGGASCGADEGGLFVKYGVDMNERAMQTYKLNFQHKGTECRCEDVFDFINQAVSGCWMVDVLHISSPCQTFSPAHTVPSIARDDLNQATLFSVGELLRVCRPRIATLEQTFGLMSHHREWFNALIKMFLDVGYSVRWTTAKLVEYGLPQNRRRLLIIAAGPGETLPPFPKATHSKTDRNLRPLCTIGEAIADIPERGSISHLDPLHDIAGAMYQAHQCKLPYSPHIQANTITTSGGIGNYHPSGKRAFTIRESAALQKFPTKYKFPNLGVTELRRQIGNAVPPFVFKKFYREIIASLKRTDGVVQ